MKGRILVINTGSTSSKIGFYDSGEKLFETNLTHSAEEVAKYESVMDQTPMRRYAITDFLAEKGIALETVDIAMARGGLITPIRTGVYEVNQEMRDALLAGKEGVHACNLSALLADDIASMVNEARSAKGIDSKCRAFIADPPMADEMLPEVKIGGLPEFPRRTLFHALNSRAMVRRYARSVGKTNRQKIHHRVQLVILRNPLVGSIGVGNERKLYTVHLKIIGFLTTLFRIEVTGVGQTDSVQVF